MSNLCTGGQGFNPGGLGSSQPPFGDVGGQGGGQFGGQGFYPGEGREVTEGSACYNPVAFSAVREEASYIFIITIFLLFHS